MTTQKSKVINLYKTLLHLGKEYPLGYDYFRVRCHRAFKKNVTEGDPKKVEQMINHGEYIVKELETLYMLKKYRTLKRRYYSEDTPTIESITKKINELHQ